MESAGTAYRTAGIRLKASVADGYAASGRVPDALKLYEEATRDLERIGRGNTSAGWTLANNHIFTLARAGRLRQAEAVYARQARADASAAQLVDLGIGFGRVLVDLGRIDEADAMLQSAADAKARLGHRRGEAYALLGVARARCARGAQAPCEEAIARARARFAAFETPDHSTFATFTYLQGLAAAERGDLVLARRRLEEAITAFDASRDRNPLRVRALGQLAIVLAQAGDTRSALEKSGLAVSAAREATRGVAESEWVGSALWAQARIHQRAGDANAAREAAREACRHLEATTADTLPALRGCRELAADAARPS